METLRAYTNECFRDIAATYSVVARVISPDFNDTSETQLATLKRDRLTDITRALSQEFAAAGRAIDTPEATAEIAATARARLAAEEA
jgi:hypothetical protein